MELKIILKALGEPMRLQIFQNLLQRKHCTRSLSKKLGVTESAVSQHLKILKEAGLIYGERYGYHVHYLPSQDALDFLVKMVKQMQRQSLKVDRNPNVCNCEFRRNQNEHSC